MFIPKASLPLLGSIFLSFTSQADEMQFFQAATHYANSCIQHHGTPYLTPDQGANWHQIDPQEMAKAAEHQKSIAVINGSMSKDKITRQQITEYIDKNVAAWANAYEKIGLLKCRADSSSLVLGNTETLSVKQPASEENSDPAQPEWQTIYSHADLEYYTDFSKSDPTGFGRFRSNGETILVRVEAECSDSSESYRATQLDHHGKDISTTIYKPADDNKITIIKNSICSDAYGRSYQ